MNQSTTAPAVREPDQLNLRFFAFIEGCTARPPDRGLWRELLDLALADARLFWHGGEQISAAALWSVGLTLYMLADSAGRIRETSINRIAARARLAARTVRTALQVLARLRVVRQRRPKRREPMIRELNLGGLDWPTIRRRSAEIFAEQAINPSPSAATVAALNPSEPPECGDRRRTLGLVQREIPLEAPRATPGTSRARDQQPADEDQQPIRKVESARRLIVAIVARSAEHDVPCVGEDVILHRFRDGKIDVGDLLIYLNETLPPRMDDSPEAIARWQADDLAGRLDRSRKGGYPLPADDPRFTR